MAMGGLPPNAIIPYNDLPSRINDVLSDGGAWFPSPGIATGHHAVGDQSNFIYTNGSIGMGVDMPADMWVEGTMPYTWTFAACADSNGAVCAAPLINTLGTGGLVDMGRVAVQLHSCPLLATYSYPGHVQVGGATETAWRNNFTIYIDMTGTHCGAYIGQLSFTVTPTDSSTTAATTSALSSTTSASNTSSSSPSSTSGSSTNTATTKDNQSTGTDSASSTGAPLSQPTSPAQPGSEKKVNVAAIAGGILGGLAVLILVAALIWYRRRRKSNLEAQYLENTRPVSNAPELAPFIIPGRPGARAEAGGAVVRAHQEGNVEMQEHPGWDSKRALFSQMQNNHSNGDSIGLNAGNTTGLNHNTNINNGRASASPLLRQAQDAKSTVSGTDSGTSAGVTGSTDGMGVMGLGPPPTSSRTAGRGQLQSSPSPGDGHTEQRQRQVDSSVGDTEGDENETPFSDAGETLPMYSEYNGHGRFPRSSTQSVPPIPPLPQIHSNPSIPEAAVQPIRDAVGIWAQANRYLISPDLERRLRSAGYVPDHDPSRMSEDVWRERYDVSLFELDTLKQLYSARRLLQDANATANS